MTRKLLLGATIIISLVGLVVIAGWRVWHQWQYRAFVESAQYYEDAQRGFGFHFPSHWRQIPEDDLQHRNERFVAGVYRSDLPSTAVGVVVDQRVSDEVFNYDSFLERITGNLNTALKDFTLLDSKAIERNGHQGIWIEYTHRHLGQVIVRQQQVIIVTAEKIYYASGTALEKHYPDHQADIDAILQSFSVL